MPIFIRPNSVEVTELTTGNESFVTIHCTCHSSQYTPQKIGGWLIGLLNSINAVSLVQFDPQTSTLRFDNVTRRGDYSGARIIRTKNTQILRDLREHMNYQCI